MVFWLIAGALTLAVGGLLLLALLRVRPDGEAAEAFDVQVYRDQLAEVDRDLARGVLSEEEAARVRVEVSRRLLEADKSAAQAADPGRAPRALSLIGAAAVLLVVVAGAAALYTRIGAPSYPDMPLKQRLAQADAALAERPSQAEREAMLNREWVVPDGTDPKFLELMDKLRVAVADNPNDVQGQVYLARNEAMLGNFKVAHKAQDRVIALKGDEAGSEEYSILAYFLIEAAEGYVSPEAEAAFETALEMDPRNGFARYFKGLMYAQSGRPDLTFGIWRPLLAESTPNAPWVPPIVSQIEQIAQAAGVRYTPPRSAAPAPALPGPSAEDMQAAGEMDAEDRQEMIRGMVENLAARLADEGGTPDEWARLINALGVLGDTDRAATIWAEAQQVFADSPEAVQTIRAAAERIGVAE